MKNKIFMLCILTFLSVILTFVPMFLMNLYFHVAVKEILCRAATMLLLMLTLVITNMLTAKTIFRIPGIIISGMIFSAMMILQILEFYNFATVGETFAMNFYTTMLDWKLILALAPSQAGQISICFIYLLLSVTAFVSVTICLRNHHSGHKKLLTAITALCFAMLGFAFWQLPNPPVNFVKMINLAKTHSDRIDYEQLKKFGIIHCNTTKETLKIYNTGTGKNLVFIILESMEKNFLDEELFPGLTPNLNRLRQDKNTLFFDNMTDSGHATAPAIFQLIYGMPTTPLTAATQGMGKANVTMMKNFVGLPYIFNKAGYSWTHIKQIGSFNELFDSENAKIDFKTEFAGPDAKSFPPPTYLDMHTFHYAAQAFRKRAAGNKPFAISLVTIDGHFPNGYINQKTLKYPRNQQKLQILDAIYNCDSLLGKFVDNIISSPQGKNTVIVITNDHLFMSNVPNLRNKKRKNFLMMINAGLSGINNTPGCQLDIPSTIIDLFKIKSNYTFPCGASLLTAPAVPLTQRMSCITNDGIIALNNYISVKSSETSSFAGKNVISVIQRGNEYILNCLGNEIVIEDTSRVFMVSLTGDNSIQNAGYVRHLSKEGQCNAVKNNLNSKSKKIFLFHGKSEINNIILDKLRITSLPVEWVLVYKDEKGNFKAVLSTRLKDLKQDITDTAKHTVNISYTYDDYTELSAADFHSSKDKKIIDDKTFAISDVSQYSYSHRLFTNGEIKFSANIKNTGKIAYDVFYGFQPIDINGEHLYHACYPANSKVKCARIVNAVAGNRAIIVSGDTSNWNKGMRLAKNAKENYSDVPNYDFTEQTIVSIKKLADGNSEITLNNPLTDNIPPETIIRPHGDKWTYLYSGVKKMLPGQSLNILAETKKSDSPFYTVNPLPRGCNGVKLVIFSFSKGSREPHTIQISNFKATKK